MSMKESIHKILLDFCIILSKKGLMKDEVLVSNINEAARDLLNEPGFMHKVHYELCDCQKNEVNNE